MATSCNGLFVTSPNSTDSMRRPAPKASVAPIAVGERVVTSGHDGIYPQGFLLGTVAQVNGTGKDREIVIAPAVNFARVDVVLILLARPASGGVPRP